MGKDMEGIFLGYAQPIVWILCQIVTFIGWWSFSKFKKDKDCEKEDYDTDDRINICNQEGLAFPNLACTFSVGAGILAIINARSQRRTPFYRVSEEYAVGAVSYKCQNLIILNIIGA